ncbi:uroporphyrinogen decarboxylase [Candidatus Rickettsiella isopodorum]|jgi:uroporphyrinogen decarboxylase|uniref:Uroporphyrinogen decarboxylase n=1 Tax=Candidatus Rickettsiella isopodorum TaxID=1225476 RepID=A0A1J8P375_9COXI|nr:uroporphyrinogen decarboxylase [Candidatus Rickettsiella isopodorum]OIZ94188.1 uroporphyrinogen decarboxylase [Candidatus Rickettsiella isopodorum]
MKNSPHCLIRALLKQPVDRTPIWIMRQAGRYLPEYRATRSKAGNFLTLCKTPELACEVTLQPLHRFDLDAAIIFSDILTIPDAMGLGLYFIEGEGPKFHKPLKTLTDIKALPIPDPGSDLNYVMQAIALARSELKDKVPLIGFAGSPWTLACYMLEGGGSKEFRQIKTLLYQEPKALHQLLNTLTKATTLYLNAQIEAGAQAIMIFDTWGGLLTSAAYQQFSLEYMSQIVTNVKRVTTREKVPIVLFTKGGNLWLEKIAKSGCDAIGLDWTIDIGLARQRLNNKVALQGNMDPAVLFANPENIRNEVMSILQSYGSGSGHVFNLGHGISQFTSPENVKIFVDAVHQLSPAFY